MEGLQSSDLLASQGVTPEKDKKHGQKTEALEASGISGFTEAVPGNKDSFGFGIRKDGSSSKDGLSSIDGSSSKDGLSNKDGSSSTDGSLTLQDDHSGNGSMNLQDGDGSALLTVQDGVSKDGSWTDGFSGDPVVNGLADGVASFVAFKSTNPFVQSLVYNTSRYVILEVGQLVFDGLSGVTSGNTLAFSIAQLKELVKDVLQKLDTILHEPSQSCGVFIDKALQAIEYERPKQAKGYLEKAVENAVKGFIYATGEGKPESMVSIMRLMIFAEITLETFDEEDGIFLGLQNPKVNQKRIFTIISANLDKLIGGIKTLKNKGWFTKKKTFEAKNQNALDQLLRQLLPTFVQLKSNDISKKTSTPESSFQMVISPRFVPQGLEDAALVSKKGFSVALWKEENLMHICFGGKVCVHPITKENVESVIIVNTDTLQVRIDGQEKDCTSITPALTEPVLTEIIQNQNIQMFFHVANYINTKKTLLRTACEFGPANCVDFILEKSPIDVNKELTYENPPLFIAAANGHDDIVKLLVEKFHADVNKSYSYGECALSYAITYNHISTVKTLVQLGAGNRKGGILIPFASLSLVPSHYVGDSDNREEISRYLTHCGIKTIQYNKL